MKINEDLHQTTDYLNIHIQLTEYCPMGCKGCYQEHLTSKSYLSTVDGLNGIIKILKKYKPKEFKISFFGGEPLLLLDTIVSIMGELKNVLKSFNIPSKLKEINIPTSGGVNPKNFENYGKELKNALPTLIGLSDNIGAKLNISLSHDGVNNIEYRNIPAEVISNLYMELKEYQYLGNTNILSEYISCVIPQNINERYFIDNFEYFKDRLNKPCTFTIPHLLDKTSELYNNPKIFQKAIKLFLEEYFNTPEFEKYKPKLFEDFESKLKTKHQYNWCGAGVGHIAIKTSGITTDCEYITNKGPELLNKMDSYCKVCEIKDYCQRPCLKNMEVGESEFLAQCLLRKIIFSEYRKILKLRINNE